MNSEPMQPVAKPQLSLVTPSQDPNANIFIYGAPKTGKTIAAASAPKPLLYLNADRPNATRMAHSLYEFDEAVVEGLQTMVAVLHLIDSRKYKTVVLDPMADVHRILLEEISGRSLHPAIQHYGDVNTHVERFCRALCEKPVNAVFVAHEAVNRDEESGAFERLPYMGTNNAAPGAKLMAMVDIVAYSGVVEQEGGDVQYVAQLVNGRGRRGGDRFGVLGRSREMNLSEWLDRTREIGVEVGPPKESKQEKPQPKAAA